MSISIEMNKIVDSYLRHMNNIEKREAVSLLLALGIKSYIQRDQSNSIDINILRQLSTNINTNNKNITTNKNSNNNKENYNEFDTTYENKVGQKVIQRPKSRNNAMSHFPFTDNAGTVEDVLSNNDSNNKYGNVSYGKLYDMGAPARKRFATQVFQDFLIDSSSHGIRVIDIPKALKALGLTVPYKLEVAFKKQVEELMNSSDDHIDLGKPLIQSGVYKVASAIGKDLEPTITLEKWLNVVNKWVYYHYYHF